MKYGNQLFDGVLSAAVLEELGDVVEVHELQGCFTSYRFLYCV